ncbi:MAG: hypothetical protein O7C75_02595, partial [Verrucomicrobia bacterium]|nr:hypothetical protein [Verrucomicrobiota bacterium]
MKPFWKAIVVCWILGNVWSLAEEPVDNQVKNALVDIAKYENQFAGQTSANPATVKRSLKLLTLTRQRLDSSSNKTHASWIEADNRYNALVAHLNKLLNPGGSSSSATATPAAQTAAAAPARQTVSSSSPASNAPQQMISQYRVRIKKIIRDINSRFDTMDKGGVKPFQDPEYAQKFARSAEMFQESIDKYADYKTDPEVVTATEASAKFTNMVNFGKQHAAKELAELGDVQSRLRSIETQVREL